MSTEYLRTPTGRIYAQIVTESNGNKRIETYGGKLLGRYNKSADAVTSARGEPMGRGVHSLMLCLMLENY